jgi:hypothetical protein
MIDTLKISNSLQEHQFSREQAEAIAAAIAEVAGAELVTRTDLDLARGALELAIERLRGELQRFILVSVVLVSAAADQILVLKIWH